MAQRLTSMNISMTRDMRAFVEQRMKAGKFANASEYIRHLVRKDEQAAEIDRIQTLLDEGVRSGSALLDESEWASIRADARARLKRRKSA